MIVAVGIRVLAGGSYDDIMNTVGYQKKLFLLLMLSISKGCTKLSLIRHTSSYYSSAMGKDT
jgi:hypothetical protein